MPDQTTMTKQRGPLNGVDVPTLFATIDAVRQNPELARFQFRVTNRWVSGTNSQSRIETFAGAGAEQRHATPFQYDADHPEVLVGTDRGPSPVEFLLHSLVTCLTAGIGNIAAARGITLTEVESTVTGNIDLRGVLGISDEVRNGYENIRVDFRIKGDAPPEKLQKVVEQARARSAVFDMLTNGVPVEINVNAG